MTAIILMFLVIQFLGGYTFRAGAFDLETSVKISLHNSGQTLVHIPPLGRINAPTHAPPLELHFTLKNIHMEQLAALVDNPAAPSGLTHPLANTIINNMIRYVVFLLALSFCLGTGSALLWRHRNVIKREALGLGLVNVLVLATLLFFTIFSYDPEGFSRAEYDGAIEAAPLVYGVLEDGHQLISNLGMQFGAVVSSVSFLQQEIDSNRPASEEKDSLTLLHISDIHNNPAAFSLIGRVLDSYEVDFIIDTGDLVDFGTSLEISLLTDMLEALPVPYIFVPGNHESPSVLEQLKSVNNVTVLERGVLEKKGLRIAAVADPAAYYHQSVVADEEIMEQAARELEEIVLGSSEPIHVVAAHNPALFNFLRGGGKILLGGHMHTSSVFLGDDYVEINAGSSGASGIRGLMNMQMEYSLVLLHFVSAAAEEQEWRLDAVDLLKINQFPLHMSYERFVLEK